MKVTFIAAAIAAVAFAQDDDYYQNPANEYEEQANKITIEEYESEGANFNKNTDLDAAPVLLDGTATSYDALHIDMSEYEGQNITADSFIDEDDEASKPICYMGGKEGIIDKTWPVEDCCRFYSDTLFRGRYIDFCKADSGGEDKNFFDLLVSEYRPWDNEVSSWKCGDKVGVDMYDEVSKREQHRYQHDSAGPGSFNWMMTDQNKATYVTITNYIQERSDGRHGLYKPGTIFDKKGCHGRSHILALMYENNIQIGDSDQEYNTNSRWNHQIDKTGAPLQEPWDPKSVWLNNGFEAEFFQGTNFDQDSVTVRRAHDAHLIHDRAGECYNLADIVPEIGATNNQPHIYRSIHYRLYTDYNAA